MFTKISTSERLWRHLPKQTHRNSVESGKKQKTVASNMCCHFLVANPPAHLKNNNARDDQTYLHQNGNGSKSQFFSGYSPAVAACRCSSCKLSGKNHLVNFWGKIMQETY